MSNIATSIEQSKELVRLGLGPNTADCMWLVTSRARLHVLDGEPISNYDRWENYPAWSLTALLEVMPITITKDGMEYKLGVFPSGLFSTHSDTSKWTLQYCGRDYSYKSRNKYPILAAITQHDIIIAAYEMVCCLLEQGLIKKGGNDDSDVHNN